MKSVLFTKLFSGLTIEDIASTGNALNIDGIDLLIRKGFQVEPTNPAGIAGAVSFLKSEGLDVPMATTDITDPAQFPCAELFAACADAGIRTIRLGFFKYDPAIGYWNQMETYFRYLDTLDGLARAAGIQLALQLHGGTVHGSGAQAYTMLKDHDPAVIGAYPDPGNQVAQDGREDWRFTFDILKPWLTCVGIKNAGWFAGTLAPTGQRHWNQDWYGLSEGMVPWDDIMTHLVSTGFDGLLTFHSHYEVPFNQVIDQTRVDLAFIHRQIERAGAAV